MGSLLLFTFACGGKVVVESTGAGGTGGGGAGGNGNGGNVMSAVSVGSVSPVGVVSASSGGSSLCQQFCDDQASKGCTQGMDCVSSCQDGYAGVGGCAPQLDAILLCFIATDATACGNQAACAAEIDAYTKCDSSTNCGPTSCSSGGNGDCDCQSVCFGDTLEVQCTPGDATDFCTCFRNGKPIAKCTQPQFNGLSCDIEMGCCADSFFPTP